MGKTDELDRLLSRLPAPQPDGNFADRVNRYILIRLRRRRLLRMGASLFLALIGLWLSFPLAPALSSSANLSGSALDILLEWVRVAFTGLQSYVEYAWTGFTGAQTNLTASIGPYSWLGITALALSGLLALGQLMTRQPGPMGKGENA